MNYNKKSVSDIEISGKKVLLRCDFNIPMANGIITDDERIRLSIPTIKYLLEHDCAVIVCSHLGRPKGEIKPELSLKPAAERLSKLLGQDVIMSRDVIGPDAVIKAASLRPGQIMLLENLRFHKEEENNDPEFAKKLASLAEVFVFDAFGSCHRAHASTSGVSDYLPGVCGFLVSKELEVLGSVLNDPKRPFIAVLGGNKASDKLGVIHSLLEKADTLLLGGGMAYTFIKAKGGEVGKSLCEYDKLDYAREMLERAKERGVKLLLPTDTLAAKEFDIDAKAEKVPSDAIPDNLMGLDIGPDTAAAYASEIASAGAVIWNGPMGVFEFPSFATGTIAIAEAMANSSAVTIVGGGDSAAACTKFGLASKMTYVSTGGGASLKFIEGVELPGIACLQDKQTVSSSK